MALHPLTHLLGVLSAPSHGGVFSPSDLQRLALAAAASQALTVAALAQPQVGRFLVDLPSGNVAPVAPGVQFTTWQELARTVDEHGMFMASADLSRLAAACTARLAQRLGVPA